MSVTTAASPSGSQLWQRSRRPLLVLAGMVVVALVIAWASAGNTTGRLDPDSVSATGSRAVAEVLRGQGVDVVRAVGIAEATSARPGDTLVIPVPDLLTPAQAAELASTGADLVVVEVSNPAVVEAFARDLTPLPGGPARTRTPGCELPAALLAGDAETGTVAYRVDPDALDTVGCYPVGGDPTVVETRTDGQRVVFIGSGVPLENDRFPRDGNAALALNVLGANDRLVWHVPTLADLPVEPQATFWELVPRWVVAALVQLGVAVLLLGAWRARRLGPVVSEPLPVVVRSAEATEGRGRMYQRAGARAEAAVALRDASARRVAARTGRREDDVRAELGSVPPPDDVSLVRLADALDAHERSVTSTPP